MFTRFHFPVSSVLLVRVLVTGTLVLTFHYLDLIYYMRASDKILWDGAFDLLGLDQGLSVYNLVI